MYSFQAKTKYPQLSSDQQAVKKMTAQAYKPKDSSNNYLHIGIGAAELQIGDQIKVSLNLGKSPGVRDQDFTYMVRDSHTTIQEETLLYIHSVLMRFVKCYKCIQLFSSVSFSDIE